MSHAMIVFFPGRTCWGVPEMGRAPLQALRHRTYHTAGRQQRPGSAGLGHRLLHAAHHVLEQCTICTRVQL